MPDSPEKPETQEQQQGPLLEGEFVEIPFPNFYANSANVGHTFMDFALTFMERLDPKHATIKARIVTSPVHAKLLLEALQIQLKKYEELYGEIRIPDSVRRKPTASSSEPAQPSSQSETFEKV